MRPLDGPLVVIRTNPPPVVSRPSTKTQPITTTEFSLRSSESGIKTKTLLRERAVRELELELPRQDPHGGPISPVVISVATATLISRIRSSGLLAREMWTQRDQFSNIQFPLSDYDLISQQQSPCKANHPCSEKSKVPPNPNG